MSQTRVHIRSFGCQMNKLDTALMRSALVESGFAMTDSVKDADAVLINTCSVREHAEQRVLSHLGHLKHLKQTRPEMIVAVTGCMAQRLGEQLLEHDAVNIVCGPAQISQIGELLRSALVHHDRTAAVTDKIRCARAAIDQSLDCFESRHGVKGGQIPGQAFVRIMRGCNNFCSYCVVPYVRGPEVCRSAASIMDQIRRLADEGVRQVTLLGQTINAYAHRAGEKTYCLADILSVAGDIEGIEWVKFVTNYPSRQCFAEILSAMASVPQVCEYLHMPAQSGSDRILKAMNRHYTAAEYLDLLAQARDAVPQIAVAGDFIVGFPGESEDDFAATVQLVRKAQYRNCFVFKYSPRPGTSADKRLQDTVPAHTKQRRNAELLAVQEQISEQLMQPLFGTTVKVLVEGLSKKAHLNGIQGTEPQLIARTSADQIVVFNGPPDFAGRFTTVRITKTSPLTLFGELDA